MAETKDGSEVRSVHSTESATTVGSAAVNKESKGLHYLKNFIGSTLKRDKNEPTRFLGDGVSFKAKLIGILEVSEARGDRMCQEALSDLKTAIRAAGEHKQRIIINIAIDGLRLRDEKTGDCLYHHPVHKISFIAQDMSDSRAFGYIFGSPDTGHRFFGIKTDKAASQVVITMRDLFQVVFELKKKEIEMAKQHIEQHQLKYSSTLFTEISHKATDTLKMRPMIDDRLKDGSGTSERGESSQEHIMDLLDLELELNNIQLGINQMDRITPSDPFGPSAAAASKSAAAAAAHHDPFGDSFNPLSTTTSSSRTKIPPPPDSGKSSTRSKTTEKHWFDHETEALFEETELPSNLSYLQSGSQSGFSSQPVSESPLPLESSVEEQSGRPSSPQKVQFDVFTDLDPLGTGRSKPYVDKKDFFQDLKNPPKKVLKDLVTDLPIDSKLSAHSVSESDTHPPTESNLTSDTISDSSKPNGVAPQLFSNAFPDDPFDKDPFSEVEFSNSIFTPTGNDPFEKFADFDSFKTNPEAGSQKVAKEIESKPVPLKVSLPPEKLGTSDVSASLSPLSLRKSRLQKEGSLSCVIKPPSPKQKLRSKLAAQMSSDAFNDDSSKKTSLYSSIPDSVSAPEPPPRSAINSFHMKPPPLPPKRIPATVSTKPPFKAPNSDYDYIENYQSTTYADVSSPPLPAPARKLRNTSKPSLDQDYYLQPFLLLPPPKKKNPKPSASPPVVNKPSLPSDTSLDITLSQLTKTGFSDLAAMLSMSPTSLSKMTLQDLTVCLAKLSNEKRNRDNGPGTGESVIQSGILNSQCYSALRESIDEESSSFKAEFDAHFKSESKKEEEESLFDKYAVFRELLEEEKQQNDDGSDRASAETSETGQSAKIEPPSEDRYAALRDICLDEVTEEKFEDLSDKEDSIIEPSILEEGTDLLPQSRAHSESTESPTITMKEHQSIIEATIMEEDNSALDGDEDVPEETVEEVKPPSPSQPRLSPQSRNKSQENQNRDKPSTDVQSTWAKFDSAALPVADSASVHTEGHMSSWSNDSKDNELPPACRDKKKQRKMRRYKQNQWQEDEESEEGWEGRVDHNSWSPSWRENGWSDGDSLYDETPPYIERDYHSPRRGRRRRMSPWNSRDQSPWEEDDHDLSEDQWEGSRWQDELRQRPKHRGQSWEEDRRRYYMEFMDEHRKTRKPMSWTNDLDRKSSRESLTWEDEERYQKRNYMERRRRKWDDDGHNRNRSWREREWTDPGLKMNNRYYKERVHDPHWDGDYGEPVDEDKSRWSQRPRSCDRARRQFASHHTLDGDFQDRRYMRTRDTPLDVDYRRKPQVAPSQKQRRKHNQSSPFEDDFSTQFGFSKESVSGPDDFHEETTKPTPSHKKTDFAESFHEFSQYPAHSSSHCSQEFTRESSTPKTCRSYQQSPFEDDFTNNEARRSSGRSASSELSDPKCSDDTFFPSPSDSTRTKRPKSANQTETKSDTVSAQSKDVSVNTTDTHYRNKLGSSQQSDSVELKPEPPRRIFKNSDSSSSICKSESVNIFARKNDPFDDDFFCEGSAEIPNDKTSKSLDSKWTESFGGLNFDPEPK